MYNKNQSYSSKLYKQNMKTKHDDTEKQPIHFWESFNLYSDNEELNIKGNLNVTWNFT